MSSRCWRISTPLVAAILAFVVLDIFAIVFGLSFMRANRAARETADGQIEVGRQAGHVAVARATSSGARC